MVEELTRGPDGYFMLRMRITVLDLSAYFGLFVTGAIAPTVHLAVPMACHYSLPRPWQPRRFNYFRFYDWTGYIALAAAILHPPILPFDKNLRFGILHFCIP